MKVKLRYLYIICLILLAYLYLSGYRFNSRQAADAHAYDILEKGAQVISKVDVGWGHAYIYKSSDYYLTVMAEKKGFLWRAPVSVNINTIDYKNDSIRTIGSMIYSNNEDKKATILVIENQNENIAFIEAGKQFDRYQKNVTKGELIIFVWNEALFQHDINPIAFSKDGMEIYRYGYPLGTNQFRDQELKWYSIY